MFTVASLQRSFLRSHRIWQLQKPHDSLSGVGFWNALKDACPFIVLVLCNTWGCRNDGFYSYDLWFGNIKRHSWLSDREVIQVGLTLLHELLKKREKRKVRCFLHLGTKEEVVGIKQEKDSNNYRWLEDRECHVAKNGGSFEELRVARSWPQSKTKRSQLCKYRKVNSDNDWNVLRSRFIPTASRWEFRSAGALISALWYLEQRTQSSCEFASYLHTCVVIQPQVCGNLLCNNKN